MQGCDRNQQIKGKKGWYVLYKSDVNIAFYYSLKRIYLTKLAFSTNIIK